MKRITAIIFSLTILLNAASCRQNSPTSSVSEISSPVTMEVSEPISLTNHMTENERSKITVGDLTVFDHMQGIDKEITIPDGVCLEIWSADNFADHWKHFREKNPDMSYVTDEEIEQNIEYWSNEPADGSKTINSAFLDGEYIQLSQIPELDYDGGELTVYKKPPCYTVFNEEGAIYLDSDGNEITEEDYNKLYEEFQNGDLRITFADFEEFKPFLHESCEIDGKIMDYTAEEVEDNYKKNVAIWEAVIDQSYKKIEYGTTENYLEQINGESTNTWEIDCDKIEEIAPFVREYSIYDEQLDSSFTVHVTLPPDFSPGNFYPAYVLTDGVWRFNNCADMRKAMEEGSAADVILVSIGFDYSMDGTDDTNRVHFYSDKSEEFLSFITDDLMPYLGEEYNIDFGNSTLYGHSLGGTFAHYAAFNSDKFENQPFHNYIIGSPVFWSPGFLPYVDQDEVLNEYGYFDRNESCDKRIFICGGADEDPVYEEYYGDNDSTLEGIQHLKERLDSHGADVECKIYPDSAHYQFIPEMLTEMLIKFYPPAE